MSFYVFKQGLAGTGNANKGADAAPPPVNAGRAVGRNEAAAIDGIGTFTAPGPATQAWRNLFLADQNVDDQQQLLDLGKNGDPNATLSTGGIGAVGTSGIPQLTEHAQICEFIKQHDPQNFSTGPTYAAAWAKAQAAQNAADIAAAAKAAKGDWIVALKAVTAAYLPNGTEWQQAQAISAVVDVGAIEAMEPEYRTAALAIALNKAAAAALTDATALFNKAWSSQQISFASKAPAVARTAALSEYNAAKATYAAAVAAAAQAQADLDTWKAANPYAGGSDQDTQTALQVKVTDAKQAVQDSPFIHGYLPTIKEGLPLLKERQDWLTAQQATVNAANAQTDVAYAKVASFAGKLMHPLDPNVKTNEGMLQEFISAPFQEKETWPDMFLAFAIGTKLFDTDMMQKASDYAKLMKDKADKQLGNHIVDGAGKYTSYLTSKATAAMQEFLNASDDVEKAQIALKADPGNKLLQLQVEKAEKRFYDAQQALKDNVDSSIDTRSGLTNTRGQSHGAIKQSEDAAKALAAAAAGQEIKANNLKAAAANATAMANNAKQQYAAAVAEANADNAAFVKSLDPNAAGVMNAVANHMAELNAWLDSLAVQVQAAIDVANEANAAANVAGKLADASHDAVQAVAPAMQQNEDTKKGLHDLGQVIVDLGEHLELTANKAGIELTQAQKDRIAKNNKKANENADGTLKMPKEHTETKPKAAFPWGLLAAAIGAKIAFF